LPLNPVGNVSLGVHQEIPWQTDNPLIRSATGGGWQLRGGGIRDVNADHGEIAVCELPDVRATATGCRFGSVCVRVRADAFKKCEVCIHADTTIGEAQKKGKHKIQCIYGSPYMRFRVPLAVVRIPKHRKVLGENIRTYRRNVKWSQEKLAEKADLHHNYIGDIERGEENVSVDALLRIATALKVRLGDLVRDA